MPSDESEIGKRIEKIKRKILSFGDFRSGSLSEQYNVCGKQGCRCKDEKNPKKHGPYYQASFYKNKKHSTFFVRKEHVRAVKNEIKNYKILKELFDEWVTLSTVLSNLRFSKK